MGRERLAVVTLCLGGGAVCLIRARSLAAPRAMAEPFVILLSRPSALSEVRASFGGCTSEPGGSCSPAS